MSLRASRWLTVLALAATARTALAESWPSDSLEAVVDSAEAIVVVGPPEPDSSSSGGDPVGSRKDVRRFRVLDVLHVSEAVGIRRGQDIRVQSRDLDIHRVVGDPPEVLPEESFETSKALLFLRPDREADDGTYSLVHSGVRFLTRGGRVLRPEWGLGSFVLAPRGAPSWEDVIGDVRKELGRGEAVRELRRIDDLPARNEALLAWMREHRSELDAAERRRLAHQGRLGQWPEAGLGRGAGAGGAIDDAVVWVVESCVPADAWAAIAFWNRNRADRWWRPHTQAPAFRSPAGRRLLLDVALDRARPAPERVLALSFLASHETLRGMMDPSTSPATPVETGALAEALTPLRAEASLDLLQAVETALVELKKPAERPFFETPVWDTPDLLAKYRASPTDRNHWARLLASRLSELAWKDLTGNPRGILVTLDLDPPREAQVRILVRVDRLPIPVFERPTLVLDRLGDDGSILDSRRDPLRFSEGDPSWSKGWDAWGDRLELPATLSTSDLAPGRWRATIEGVAGGRRLSWRSESREFVLPPPR